MDRTSWIIVTVCVAGLAAWFVTLPKPPPRPQSEVVRAATPAATPATGSPSESGETGGSGAGAGGTGHPRAHVRVRQRRCGIRVLDQRRRNQDRTLPPHRFSGATPTVLNEAGVAADRRALPRPRPDRRLGLRTEKPGGKAPVIFERLAPGNILVRKTWTPVSDGAGKGFLWKLAVTFKNKSDAPHAAVYSLYAGDRHPTPGKRRGGLGLLERRRLRRP